MVGKRLKPAAFLYPINKIPKTVSEVENTDQATDELPEDNSQTESSSPTLDSEHRKPRSSTMADASASLKADPILLDKIDKLFACGVGEYVDLPQIVVVGDQSSGKSSVLEGITKLPFPRDSGLCTRFATKIIFRRSARNSITASVIPAESSSPEHVAEVKNWEKLEIAKLDPKPFADLMSKVRARKESLCAS